MKGTARSVAARCLLTPDHLSPDQAAFAVTSFNSVHAASPVEEESCRARVLKVELVKKPAEVTGARLAR
jgi:hypothetical protein